MRPEYGRATYQVVWPLGRSAVDKVEQKPVSDDLSGKTIAFIWDYLFRGPEMFDAIKDGIREIYNDVSFIDYERFGNIHGADPEEKANLDSIPDLLRQEKTDLVVAAVGA